MSDTFGPQLDALAASLRDAGLAASVDDVRDILWLAEVRGPATGPAARVSGPITADTDRRRAEAEASGIDARATGTPATPTRDESTLYASAQHGHIEAGMLHVPGVTVSPAPADLRRALQPLARYVASTTRWQLDDEATATYKADTGAWRLCLQPLRDRWFDLNVIVEVSPSMRLWRTEVDSFVRVLKGQGGFRSLRRFVFAGPGPALLHTADGSPSVPLAALQPAGRQALTLLVSDTGSALWRSGAAQRFLFSAGALMPLSVMQLLPTRAWRHTALGEPEMAARTTHPGSPNAQLLRVGDDDEIDADDGLDADRCLVPVLSLDSPSIRRWALAMAGRVNASVPCAAVTRNPVPPSESSLNQTASEAVAAFRRKVSQAAYDLAVFLTVPDPLTLPVMRLVQRTMLPDTGTAELSECLLGGLLVPTSEDAGADAGAVYRFRDGVRDELIRALRYSEEALVTQQLARVGRTLEQAHVAGAGSEFSAYFPQPGGGARLSKWALPFATVSRRILQALQPAAPDPQHEAGSLSANAEVNAGPVAATPSPQAGPRPSAYLSAVHAETEQLQPWMDAFRREGLQVMTMTALLAANDDLSGRVRFGLGQASCALVAISHAWHTSKWCQQEARLLSERARNDPGFRIITLRLDDAAMPFDFRSWLTLDLRGGTRPDLTTIHALVDGLRGASLKANDEGRRKVLWVDDVPNNNVREREIMESMGVEFTLARSTREALELFKASQFAVIISDMKRAEGSREGYVLLEAIRALDPIIPFFLYAGLTAVQHRREAVQRGAQGSTNQLEELIEWVTQAVTNSASTSAVEADPQPAPEPWFADENRKS